MAKITAKADIVLGTNLKLHITDKGGTDISITDNADGTGTIDSTTTDFTTSSETGGIVNKAITTGDILKVSRTGIASNEGKQIKVTTVTANQIEYDDIDTLADESAGSDINLTTFDKEYEFLEANGLSFVDGVGGIVLASKMVDLWDTTDLDIYDPAFTSIEPRAKSMASINGWKPFDANTLKALRDIAIELRATANSTATKIYACLRSGNLNEANDQFYFWFSGDAQMTAPTNAVTTQYLNEPVLIYDDNNGSPIDKRGNWFIRCAEVGKTIAMQQLALNYAEIVAVTVTNAIDVKLTAADVDIAAGGDWANIEYNSDVDGVYEGDVDGVNYNFAGYIEGDNKTNEIVHQKINYLLRQPTNINSDGAGADFRGDKQDPMTIFVGDGFTTNTYLLNYNASQRNNLTVVDNTGAELSWPTIFTLQVLALILAVTGKFSLIHEDTFGTADVVYLKDENDVDQKDITIQALVSVIVAYSTYNNGGHTPNTPIKLRLTWNRPGVIEPDNVEFTMNSDYSVTINPKADPSYIA